MRLHLACGSVHKKGWINVDINPDVNPDRIVDLNKNPYPFESNSCDYILAEHVLEHLTIHPIDFFQECYRILKFNGILEFTIPNMLSLKNRFNFLFGRIIFLKTWHPFHTKLVNINYIRFLVKYMGFEPEEIWHKKSIFVRLRLPKFRYDLFSSSCRIKARKKP